MLIHDAVISFPGFQVHFYLRRKPEEYGFM